MNMNDLNPVELVRAANDNNNDGFGGGNGILWVLLFMAMFGWGGNRGWGGNGGGYAGGAGAAGGDMLYPWMNLAQSIWTGFSQIQQDLCGGFAGVTGAITGGFANAETAATARQMATQNQLFGLSQQFSDCCCENRLGLANLGADIAREACADRAAVSDGVRDILANQIAVGQRQIDNQNQWGQRVIDWLCADRDARKDEIIAELRQQVMLKDLAASQSLQTAQLTADNAAQTAALEQYLAPVPRPAYMVQNPNCCQSSFGYGGCGCAA